ncbi:MAG TPA: hypothetical protein VJR06_05810 [Nitrososphaerales archaeon]|nr:hypothetical protein [Nitrososphaerales archaeon]
MAAHTVFIGVAAVVAIVVLASSVGIFPTGSGGPVPSGLTSTSVMSVDGLRLSLQISTASDRVGGTVMINVSETNTNPSPLNESAAHDWAVVGLRMDMCYASVYPFGVAVYPGHYTEQNVSSAKPVNLYPVVPCPLLIRYITGYYFQRSSNMALVLPGSGSSIAMTSGVAAAGNYTWGYSLSYFTRGPYTVVAGDEWGALAFLYFTVA